MTRLVALSLILALGAPIDAEPGCEAQATSAKPIALEASMSLPPLASRFNVHGFVVITAPPRHTTTRLRFENEDERVPPPASCEPGGAWALVKFDPLADGTTANAAIEQACPPGEHGEAVLEAIRSYKDRSDVPAPIVGARELYPIEGEITKQASVPRLSRFQ